MIISNDAKYSVLGAIILMLGMTACQKKVVPPPEPKQEQEAIQQEVNSQDDPAVAFFQDKEIVMVSGDLKLTMNDYDRCLAVHRIKGHDFSKRALANPRFQRDEVQRCFQTLFLRDYLKKNQIAVDPADHQEAVSRWTAHADVANLEELSKKLGIDSQKIDDYIDDTILPITVQKALVKSMSDKDLRQLFNIDARKMTVEIAVFDNTPTDEEVDHYIAEDEEEMKKYLGIHQELLNSPPHVTFVRLAYAGDSEEIQQNAEKLRSIAMDKGMEAALDQCKNDENKGCIVLNGPDNLLDEERTDENAWAFREAVGKVSDVQKSGNQFEIRISTDILPPQPYNLGEPEVKKRVARQVLMATEPAEHLIVAIKPALEAENVEFEAVVAQNQGQYQKLSETYESLVHSDMIKSPQIRSLLASIQDTEVGLFANPVMEDGKLYIVRVLSLDKPTEEDFVRDVEAWKMRRANDSQLRTVNSWLQNAMPRMTSLNILPIQSHYGILQPNGSIRE